MKKILIADDNIQITNILKDYAIKEGFETIVVHDGAAAVTAFQNESPDILLLDVMMPKLDGFDVCKKIRETSSVPIIMVTAKGENYDRIMGLDIGADDYIVKPFSPAEVMARVRAILRRITPLEDKVEMPTIFSLANLQLDFDTSTAIIDQTPLRLTVKEFEILWLLAHNPNKIFSRDNLLDSVWGIDYYGDIRTVDSHIKRLRAKIDTISHPMWDIATIWGRGYQFEYSEEHDQ